MGGKKRVVEKKKKKILAELPADCRSERKHRKFLGHSIITRLKIVSNDGHYSRGEEKLGVKTAWTAPFYHRRRDKQDAVPSRQAETL